MHHSFWATLLSLSGLSAPIQDSGRKISHLSFWWRTYLCICTIHVICIIWVVPCDLHWESLCLQSIYVYLTFKPCWIYFMGSQIHIEGGGGFWCSDIRSQDSGSGLRFRPERWISCEVTKGFVELERGEFERVSGLQCSLLIRVCWRFGESVWMSCVFWCGSARI